MQRVLCSAGNSFTGSEVPRKARPRRTHSLDPAPLPFLPSLCAFPPHISPITNGCEKPELGSILPAGGPGWAMRAEWVEKLPDDSLGQRRPYRAVAARPDLLAFRHVEGPEEPIDDRQVGDVILVDRLIVARMMPVVVARRRQHLF